MCGMLNAAVFPSSAPTKYHVVLLHAFPLSSTMWEAMIAEFEDLRDDTTFIAFDFPGFGTSAAQENWSLAALANDIAAKTRTITTNRVVVAGLSMGGYAALALYRQVPGMVRGLVLANTRAAADTDVAKRGRQIFATDARKRGAEAAIERLYSGFVTEATDPDTAVEIHRWICQAQGDAIAEALAAMAAREDSTDLLRLVTVPSLLITGSRDTVILPEEMRDMAKQLRDSTLMTFDGAAHLTCVERPREWAEALASYLERLP